MDMTGASLWQSHSDSARRLGIQFELASRVHELIQDGDGRVKRARYGKIIEPTGWAAMSYKVANRDSQTIRDNSSPRCLDCLADKIRDQVAVEKTLEANNIILAAGVFVCK